MIDLNTEHLTPKALRFGKPGPPAVRFFVLALAAPSGINVAMVSLMLSGVNLYG